MCLFRPRTSSKPSMLSLFSVLKNGQNTSGVYRFKLAENRYVFVQTKSKLFSSPNSNEPEFIMSTHSIVR